MLKFIMVVGLPGSGKSTLAKNKKEEILKDEKQKVEIVSSDEIREKIFGNINIQDYNTEVFKIMKILTLGYLRKNISVIYDATNLSRKRRKNLLNELYRELKDISFQTEVITMLTDYEYCLIKNSERERKVPEESIKKMLCSFQCPTLEEGWDDINFSKIGNITIRSIDEIIEQLCNYNQNNPYHSLTLGNHIKKSINYLEDNYKDYKYKKVVREILKYHDIGKIKACTKKEDRYYSYKGHEFASSYFYLSTCFNNFCLNADNILIAEMIEAHMIAHRPEMEKTLRKMNFNSNMIEIMKIVAECDDAGK